MRQAYFIVGLLLGVALTIFALQNSTTLELRFLFWQTQGPGAAVILLSAIGGFLVALFFGLPEIISARWRIRSLERRLAGGPTAGGGPAAPPLPEDGPPRTT